MKGVILAGGLGTRLRPLTSITNKHLLPVYDRPMILFPLETLKRSGIKDIMVVCGKEHGGDFMNFLGSGKEFGVQLSYAFQHDAGGIAQALSLSEDFADEGKIAVILGDNLFEQSFASAFKKFGRQKGAKVFFKKVTDPERFGVPEFENKKIISLEEKPAKPKTAFAQTGLYLYDPDVFDKIRKLKPSARGELEITDVNNLYLKQGRLAFEIVRGHWSDMGTSFNSLLKASQWVKAHRR